MTGHLIAHYHVVEKLGEGGMGAVFKARDTHLNRLVALKLLPADKVSDPDRRRRFVLEARAASALNHPNIVTIHDVASDGDVHFIAMEYISGRTLAEVVSCRPLPVPKALEYAIQIADALATAHAAGIVHRDLKPANLMLTDAGVIKVLDFGLAKLTEAGSRSVAAVDAATASAADRFHSGVAMVGTAGYMSPEQVECRPVDARSDIFAFGAVLYELTTGRRAFMRDSIVATLSAILHEQPPATAETVSGVPRGVQRVIARCLEKNPDRRFQHMADVRFALEDLRDDLDDGGAPTSTARAGDGAPGSRLGRWLVAAIVVVAAAGGVAVWRWPRSTAPVAHPLAAVPLTTYPGSESYPSLSPDGNQVAFTWNGEHGNYDVYVKLVGPGAPLRLTTNPAPDTSPAWSPDGRWIAFLRVFPEGRGALILVPALGGAERRLADVVGSPFLVDSIGRALAWSPDSTTLVAAADAGGSAPQGLFAFSVATGERRRLTSLPPRAWIDTGPAFSPDGRMLTFARFSSFGISDLYGLALDGGLHATGEARRLTSQNRLVNGPVWTPDGRRIVFSSGSLMTGVERLFAFDASAALHATGLPPQITPFGERGAFASIARMAAADRSRMVYSQSHSDTGIWRIDLRGEKEPAIPAERKTEPFILSTQMEYLPQYSPNGEKVAFVSLGSGAAEIWVCDKDGANLLQLTSAGWPETATPRWSPDGAHLVFQARPAGTADLFSIAVTGGVPRRVTEDPADDWGGSWSRDGHWIYFGSNRSGQFEIWKAPVAGGPAVQITRSGGYGPSVSPDGRYVYFLRRFELWRVAVDTGDEQRLLEAVSDWSRFAVTSRGIYFTSGVPLPPGNPTESAVEFFDFKSRRVSRVLRPDKALYIGLAVSPDERWLLFTQFDQTGSDLMLIDDFR